MSIIPFIPKGSQKTVTDDPNEFSITGSWVYLYPMPSGLDIENSCVDLHVGGSFRSNKGNDVISQLPKGECIEVHPGDLVSIMTQESVQLPNERFGYILPKVNLLSKGLTNVATKVDPGYHGPLIVNISNLSRSPVKLTFGQSFCTLIIHQVEPAAISYSKGPKGWQGLERPMKYNERLSRWVARNMGLLTIATPIIALIAIIISLFPFIAHKANYGTWLSR